MDELRLIRIAHQIRNFAPLDESTIEYIRNAHSQADMMEIILIYNDMMEWITSIFMSE